MNKNQDKGFTLVELLIVIVILGILATVTVFAVRGITDQGEANACAVEQSCGRDRDRGVLHPEQPRPTPVLEADLVPDYVKEPPTYVDASTYTGCGSAPRSSRLARDLTISTLN